MPISERDQAALGQLLELAVLLNADMSRMLAREGLTVSRAHVIWQLQQRGPLTQRDLAEALDVSARTVTGLIDGLAATRFVTREPHPTDRRATLVTLTARGAATAESWAREQEEFAHLLFGEMPERQLDCFVNGLGEVLATLRKHIEPPAATA